MGRLILRSFFERLAEKWSHASYTHSEDFHHAAALGTQHRWLVARLSAIGQHDPQQELHQLDEALAVAMQHTKITYTPKPPW